MKKNKMKNYYILLAIIVAIAGVYYVSNLNRDTTRKSGVKEEEMVNENGYQEPLMKDMPIVEVILNNEKTKVNDLKDVTGGDSSGKGYILRDEFKLYHYVMANLPDLEDDSKYEGWLVKKEPKLEFFSTGIMQKQRDGTHVLVYMSNNLYEDYDFIVITEETVMDDIPEKHILETIAK